jgi:hypothetical protein
MVIKNKSALSKRKIEIDLTGPQGNAYCLMGMAQRFARELDKDPEVILTEMKSGNYDHLVKVFDREFGEFVILYR